MGKQEVGLRTDAVRKVEDRPTEAVDERYASDG
jgi:hypothetical protein